MTITIRQITAADAAGFNAALDVVAREKKYLVMTEAPPLAATQAFVAANIAKGFPQLVAIDDERAENRRVIGWCDVIASDWPTMAHCGTLGMGLLPAYRGQGLGARLMARTLEDARAFGYYRVQLHVLDGNARAEALYVKFGFVAEGRRRAVLKIDGVYIDDTAMALIFG